MVWLAVATGPGLWATDAQGTCKLKDAAGKPATKG